MHVDRDSSLGGRAPKSGCREESYTSEYFSANVALSEHDIHSAPVYMPPLFMPDDRLLSFSCFRNFLAIEGNSDPELKKKNGIRYTSISEDRQRCTVIDPISNFFQIIHL